MQERTGNLWEPGADAYVVTTNLCTRNGRAIMGGGVAREAAELWPELPALYGADLIKSFEQAQLLHGEQAWPEARTLVYRNEQRSVDFVCMPTKYNVKRSSTLPMVLISAMQLLSLAESLGWQKLHVPRPGCGLGGLDWATVGPLLNVFWDDRFIVYGY